MKRPLAQLAVCVALGSAAAARGEAFQRGVCYASAWQSHGVDGYGSPTSTRTLGRLRRLGVEWIAVTPFGFMASSTATEVTESHFVETDERLRAEVAHAHALGLKVTLKPHLWIGRGDWAGDLAWASDDAWRRWFASYRLFVLGYARLAEREHYDLFVLGTELRSATSRDPEAWRSLIADVRRVFQGPITYAANWDEAEHVPFWDALDYVGVDEYAPIAKTRGAAEPALCAAWNELAKSLEGLSRRTGKRVLLTELGYRATRDAAMNPSAWPEHDERPQADPVHQASCFRAALQALWGRPWLAGIYVWKWYSDGRDEQGPTDFSFADKPAEAVLRDYYRRRLAGETKRQGTP